MCFGGGGQQQQPAPPQVNVTPAPVIKQPEPPPQLTQTYKPLQSPAYIPTIQEAGATRRRQDLMTGRRSMARRRGLSTGIAASSGSQPSGGINL